MSFPQWKTDCVANLTKLAQNMDETAVDLLQKMVQLEPSKRISAKEALAHPYFQGMDASCSAGLSLPGSKLSSDTKPDY